MVGKPFIIPWGTASPSIDIVSGFTSRIINGFPTIIGSGFSVQYPYSFVKVHNRVPTVLSVLFCKIEDPKEVGTMRIESR